MHMVFQQKKSLEKKCTSQEESQLGFMSRPSTFPVIKRHSNTCSTDHFLPAIRMEATNRCKPQLTNSIFKPSPVILGASAREFAVLHHTMLAKHSGITFEHHADALFRESAFEAWLSITLRQHNPLQLSCHVSLMSFTEVV